MNRLEQTPRCGSLDDTPPVELVPTVENLSRASGPSRRRFLQTLGAGLLVAVAAPAIAQPVEPGAPAAPAPGRRGGGGARGGRGGGGGPVNIAARVHIDKAGLITVMTGKVECGQGSRAQITMAAAEELRVAVDQIRLIMADTGLCPDDGPSYGSQTTPRTIPSIRQGAAAAREALIAMAIQKWGVARTEVDARDGKVIHAASGRAFTFAELVGDDSVKAFSTTQPANVSISSVKDWKVMGTPVLRPDRRDLVRGQHQYPSDIVRPGMLYGQILRAPGYGAKLKSIDIATAQAMKDVTVVHDGDFVGVAAPTTYLARKAIAALSATAQWDTSPQVASKDLFDHLQKNVRGGIPANPYAADVPSANKSLRATYEVAYVQHAPLEPRAAVAEWAGGNVTVWTGTQNPFGVRAEVARALNIGNEAVRLIVPDFGGGFGGKHPGDAAVEAARLSKGAGKPVWIRWTREEEFTWAQFRPAGVILAEASLDRAGALSSWYFLNINSGPSAVNTPYRVAKNSSRNVGSAPPLREGSYRGLAATANNFARECFMDELAAAAGLDPLAFRLNHLDDARMKAVLQTAAEKFDWANRSKQKIPHVGVGIACGVEKGSYLATCAQIAIDPRKKTVAVTNVCQAYECGKIINPAGLMSQVQGAIVMGIGPAIREEIQFEKGQITNGTFADYEVPRFADLPEIDVQLVDRPDIASAGAGETPIIGIAPAIANAVFNATGTRVRQMPIKLV